MILWRTRKYFKGAGEIFREKWSTHSTLHTLFINLLINLHVFAIYLCIYFTFIFRRKQSLIFHMNLLRHEISNLILFSLKNNEKVYMNVV